MGATKKQNACQCCRTCKLKCECSNGYNAACQRCEDSGAQAECTVSSKPPNQGTTQHATCGHSLPPSTITVPQAGTQTATRTGRKHGYFKMSDPQTQGLGQQHTRAHKDDLSPIPAIGSLPAGSQAQKGLGLEVIRESDEDEHEDRTQLMDDDQDPSWGTTQSTPVTWSSSGHASTTLNEDSNKSNSSWHSDESDSSDDDSVEISEPRHQKPSVHPGKKAVGRKPYSKRAGRAGKGNDGLEESDINCSDNYDPETCGTYTAYTLTWEVSH